MKIKNILIIHNSASDRELLSEFILSGIGAVDIVKVASEFKALQLLKERQFDVIFSSMILNRFAELPLRNTQVIALISEPTDKTINELSGHGIQQYLTFPINQQAVQNKLNAILRDGISRKYPRYSVPGTKVSLQHGLTEIEGDVSHVSKEGVLCEFTLDGSWEYLTKDCKLTFRFSKQFGNSRLKDLECKYLITRGIEKKGTKTVVQVVFLLPILKEEQKLVLNKVLGKAERLQNPMLTWRENRLEVKFLKHKYLFYKVHLIRLSLLSLLIIAGSVTLFLNRQLIFGPSEVEKHLQVIWRDGQLLTKADQEKDWQPTEAQQLPQDYQIKVSKAPLPALAPTSTSFNAHAVIRYSPTERVHITQGGTVKRDEAGDLVTYRFSGAAHLLIQPDPNGTLQQLRINGVEIATRKAHIYYQALSNSAELNVIEGTLELYPNQPLFLSIAPEIVPENGKILITTKHQIVLTQDLAKITTQSKGVLEFFDQTYLPGFNSKGPFEHIGYALAEKAPYTLQRHSNSYQVKTRQIPIMVNDSLSTNQDSRVIVSLLDGNRIKLYEQGRLDFKDYQLNSSGETTNPDKEGSAATKNPDSNTSNLKFHGRLRVNLNAENPAKEIRFQSETASLQPEKAVFETITHPQRTELLVLSNSVDISDLGGKNTLTIPQGMMASLENNQLPQKPEPIPRTRIRDLLKESLDSERQLSPSSLNLSNLNQIILKPDASLPFYWNTGLRSAKVVIGNKSYPVRQKRGSVEMILGYRNFKGAKTGKQTAMLQVVDLKGREGSHKLSLVLLPRLQKTTIPGKIGFERGRSVITPDSLDRLERTAKAILNDKKLRRISVEGHSDSDGLEIINLRLSQKRADVVKQTLIDLGIPENMITAKGFGSRFPIAGNAKRGEKALNRRVEIIITRESSLVE